QGVDIDLRGKPAVRKKAGAGDAVLIGVLHLRVDGELLGSVLRDTAELAGIANTVALVALFVRNAAGSGSLLCLAGSSYEPLPVPFLFRGDINPLLERTVVDG